MLVPASTGSSGIGITTDDTNVYWANRGPARSISKVPLAGGSVIPLVSGTANGVVTPIFVAVDTAFVYFTDQTNVMKASLDLNGGVASAIATNQTAAYSIVTDGTNLYWSNGSSSTGAIMKMPNSGGSPVAIASAQNAPYAVAIDANYIYWVNYGDFATTTSNGTVMRAPINGGLAVTLADGQDHPRSIAIDTTNVYWTTSAGVWKVQIGGGTPTNLVTGRSSPTSIAVDATSLYWDEPVTGGPIMKLTPK